MASQQIQDGGGRHPKMAAAAIFNFGKISKTPDWIKISAPNFMARCIRGMRR